MEDVPGQPEETTAPSFGVASNGKATVKSMRPPGSTTWKRIGRMERHLRGVKISFPDLSGASHLFYIRQHDIQRITDDRVSGDVVTIDETVGEGVVISTEGQAYRSRSGQALILKVPGFAGAEVMAPWGSFLAVLEGLQRAAPLSVLQKTRETENRHRNTNSTLSRGPAAGWF